MGFTPIVLASDDNLKSASRLDLNSNFAAAASGVDVLEGSTGQINIDASGNQTEINSLQESTTLLKSPSGNYNWWNKTPNGEIDFLTCPSGILLYTPPSGKRFISEGFELISDKISPSGNALEFTVGTDANTSIILPSGSFNKTNSIDERTKFSINNVVIPEETGIKLFITQRPTHTDFIASSVLRGELVDETYYSPAVTSPDQVEGMMLWIDPSQETAYSDGDECTVLHDFSGNNHHFDNHYPGQGRGLYKTDGPNNQPYIYHNHEHAYFENMTMGFPTGDWTVFIVAKNLNFGPYISQLRFEYTLNTHREFMYNLTGANLNQNNTRGFIESDVWTDGPKKWYLPHSEYQQDLIYTSTFSVNGGFNRLNGIQTSTIDDYYLTEFTAPFLATIGDTHNDLHYLYELIIYDRKLSENEIEQVEDYLSDKYDLGVIREDEVTAPDEVVVTNAAEDWRTGNYPNGTYTKMATTGYEYMDMMMYMPVWVNDSNHHSYECTISGTTYTIYFMYDDETLTSGNWVLANREWEMGRFLASNGKWLYSWYPPMGDWKTYNPYNGTCTFNLTLSEV